MKSKQILKWKHGGDTYLIIEMQGDLNPYRLIKCYITYSPCKHHKQLMAKYADLKSCFYWFLQNVNF